MEPTANPENGRQSRGLARFWPVHGMPVPAQRHSDEDGGDAPPARPSSLDGSALDGSAPPQSEPRPSADHTTADPTGEQQLSDPRFTHTAPTGRDRPSELGSPMPAPQAPAAPPPALPAQQPDLSGYDSAPVPPRHPAVGSDTQMVALGSRRGSFDPPGNSDQRPNNVTALRGWTGNQPGFGAGDVERAEPARNGDAAPRHAGAAGPVGGSATNGLPGTAGPGLPTSDPSAAFAPPVSPLTNVPLIQSEATYPEPGAASSDDPSARRFYAAPDPSAQQQPAQQPSAQQPSAQQQQRVTSPQSTPAQSAAPQSAAQQAALQQASAQLAAAQQSAPLSPAPFTSVGDGWADRSAGVAAPGGYARGDDQGGADLAVRGDAPRARSEARRAGTVSGTASVSGVGRRSRDENAPDTPSVEVPGQRRSAASDESALGAGRPAAPSRASADGSSDTPGRPGDVAQTRITLWDDEATRQFHDEWHELKAQFVDDPVTALTRAHDLLTEAVHELTEALLAERDDLDPLRSTATPDTESMRMAMRGYREFLDRILAL